MYYSHNQVLHLSVVMALLPTAMASNPRDVSSPHEVLFHQLLDDYDVYDAPLEIETLEVTLEAFLVEAYLNQQFDLLFPETELHIVWRDYRLVWNSADFGGIDHVQLTAAQMWIPNVQNGQSASTVPDAANTLVTVHSNGTAVLHSVNRAPIHCQTEEDADTDAASYWCPFVFQLVDDRGERVQLRWALGTEGVNLDAYLATPLALHVAQTQPHCMYHVYDYDERPLDCDRYTQDTLVFRPRE